MTADEIAQEGLRTLADAHRGARMKALHEKKRGPAAPAQKPAAAPQESEDDFLGAPDLDELLKG